ncbi:MAG: carboxylating nicotinate-nucleotide diphosphorylase [Candidatus Bathyarchaeota archaeon]|nr:carboxylating nicotinate-nucleotide diphosphorylase [Candidatus Bathyarchaeota archaeon]
MQRISAMFVPRKVLEEKLLRLLTEDIGQGDATTYALVPSGLEVTAEIIAKDSGVVAGVEEATVLAEALGLKVVATVVDGSLVKNGQVFMRIQGDAKTILAVERTLLNLVSRMSGIATATRNLTEKLKKAKLNSKIAATRKTAPGLLFFDKKAVVIGGGDTHRLHLDDMVLIKDNHLALTGSLERAVKNAKQNVSFSKKIEVEVENPQDALKAAELGADIVMLDNFSPQQIKEAVSLLKKGGFFGRVMLEASGGITPENLLDFASAGVDVISLGELTHSVKALDLSLEIIKAR